MSPKWTKVLSKSSQDNRLCCFLFKLLRMTHVYSVQSFDTRERGFLQSPEVQATK